MIEDLIKYCESVYHVAYLGKKKFQAENKPTLIYALEIVIRHEDENKKRILLGDEAYIDYLKYKNQMKQFGLSAFSDTLEFMYSKEIDMDKNEKTDILNILIEKKEICQDTIIATKMLKNHNYFSVKKFEELIPLYEEQDRAFRN